MTNYHKIHWDRPQEYFSPEWHEKMHTLELKYQHVPWTPLDIPKFEFDSEKLIDLWDREYHDCLRIKSQLASPWTKDTHPLGEQSEWYQPMVRELSFYEGRDNHAQQCGYFSSKLYQGNDPMFTNIVDQVMAYYPIVEAMKIYIWESVQPVPLHQDQSCFFKVPADFRCMLYDSNPRSTLYTVDFDNVAEVHPNVYQSQPNDRSYIELVDDTNHFAINNGSGLHGSDFEGHRKLLLCIMVQPDPDGLEQLLDRSIAKYAK